MVKNLFAGKPASPIARALTLLPALFLVSLAAGCAGLVEKSGEVLEGSAFGEKTAALYRSEKARKEPVIEARELAAGDGEGALELSSTAWPGLVLRGTLPERGGSFQLLEAGIVSSHAQGWNELKLQLLGSAEFRDEPQTGPEPEERKLLRIQGEAERVQISSGKIRLKASRLSGEAALLPLRNRRERILALTEWMAEERGLPAEAAPFREEEGFANYWKPLLFPELVSRRKRPPEYAEFSGGDAVEWVWADSVKWNRSYTAALFPEGLREYRDSGALLRDWEEALPWIYLEYSWDLIISSFNEISLRKQ